MARGDRRLHRVHAIRHPQVAANRNFLRDLFGGPSGPATRSRNDRWCRRGVLNAGGVGSRTSAGPTRLLPAAFLELFFDLAFVFALTRVSQRLINEVNASEPERNVLAGAAESLFFFLALWLIWMLAAWVTSLYDPEQAFVQALVIIIMLGVLMLAITMPHAFGSRAAVFAGTYVTIQLGRPLLLTVALRRHPRQR
ncbi:low temperature requirement protein A [Micromonospora sp. M12]